MSMAIGNVQVIQDNKKYFNDKIGSLSDRQGIWLRNNLASTIDADFMQIPSTDSKNGLILALSRYENFKDIIEHALLNMAAYLIPEENFKWLINDLRAQIFSNIILITDFRTGNQPKNYGEGIMNSIYNFFDFLETDSQPMHINAKIDLLNNIRLRWDAVRQEDNYSEWLDEKDVKQIEWTKDYLNTKNHYCRITVDRSNYSEIRAVILGSLDLIDPPVYSNDYTSYKQSDRKERVIDKMKRAWSQQKYRDAGKTKKPYHLPLTQQTQERLERMASIQNTTATLILDMLINSAYETDYVDRHGKDIY